MASLQQLLREIRACRHCEAHLPLGPRPVLAAAESARIMIVGQAPGTKVHATGIPWNDPSGIRLRQWLDMEPEVFYDEHKVAIIPMGFCYPGKGERGDLPPRPECAALWQEKLRSKLPDVRLILAIGQYAQRYYLGRSRKKSLAETVRHWESYLPQGIIPLPHPSPRNIMWRRKNPWFEAEVVPAVRRKVWEALE
ncbi:MAG: uracil-DNA glycosylase family protein [Bacteroidetes bacterium]|nr:MAG: uracil-DNA glycosylase family protein [Bacteroidota bacterium]